MMRIRRPFRLALVVAGLAGGWWAGALLGEHYNVPPPPPPQGRPTTVHAPATGPAAMTRPAAPAARR
jgi:hypothetical protein